MPNPQQQGGPFGNMMNVMNMVQKFQQFRTNPVQALLSMNPKLHIPQNIANDYQAVVQHLIDTGQMTQDEFNQFSQMANQFQFMLPRF